MSSTRETPTRLKKWSINGRRSKTESAGRSRKSVLDGIPAHLPALARSQKLQKKAAKSGFDWDDIEDVFAKLDEEVAEFKEAVRSMDSQEATSELGDMLFVMVNIAKFKKLDAEEALRQSNNKFIRRFQHIEAQAASLGRDLKSMTLEEMETYWQEAKGKEI